MSFPRYERYKYSGVEGLGEVPEHWQVKRLRFAARINPSKSEANGLEKTLPVSFVPMEAISEIGPPSITDERTLADVEAGYTYFRDDDIAVAKITPCFENGKRAHFEHLTNGIGFGTTELHILRARHGEAEARFLFWVCASSQFMGFGTGSMYGTGGQQRVPEDFVKDYSTTIPEIAEQQVISAFLDKETAKLDALIEEQRRLIELLKEKRQAVVSHAVTKGLNPNVAMNDSDVDWIGDVPRHWIVTRLGYFATVENGTTPSKEKLEYWTDGQVPWLASGEVNQLRIVEANEFITEQALAKSSLRLLPEGTVVVGLVGQGKTRGMSAILCMTATINQNLAAVCPGPKISSEYVFYLFQAMYVSLREDGRGGNQAAINCKMLAALQIPVPPIQEQNDIAAFLNTLTEQTDTLENESNGAIQLLQERRSALISAAVNGKIDVRNYTPKEAA